MPNAQRQVRERAGALHDVIEDTPCSLTEVRAQFGNQVAGLVEQLTLPPYDRQSAPQVRRAFFAHLQSAPLNVVTVKLADRLSNVQRLDTHPRPEKRREYYRKTVEVILPIARRIPWFDWQFQAWQRKFAYLASAPEPVRKIG